MVKISERVKEYEEHDDIRKMAYGYNSIENCSSETALDKLLEIMNRPQNCQLIPYSHIYEKRFISKTVFRTGAPVHSPGYSEYIKCKYEDWIHIYCVER